MTELLTAPTSWPADQRRRWSLDTAIALAVTILQLLASHATYPSHQQPGWPAYLLLAVAGLVLIARRRYPVAVLAVSLGVTLWAGAISNAGLVWIALIAAFVNAVLLGRRAAAIAALVIGYLVSFWPLWQLGSTGHASVAVALGAAAWLLVLLAVAEFIRIRGQRSAERTRILAEQVRRRASEDRMRMARDLHDVLAHNISVINVQANTALHLMDRQPERAREALTAIHDVSKQALSELRSVLGVLRADGDDAPRAPSPGLAQLDDLVAAIGDTGRLAVRLAADGDHCHLPPDVDLAAYRIVQEALTNVSRHSASRSAEVQVSYQHDGVRVQVDDNGPALAPLGRDGTGHGLSGMTERAGLLGGSLQAGRRSDGGFRVLAWLPRPDRAGHGPAPVGSSSPAKPAS